MLDVYQVLVRCLSEHIAVATATIIHSSGSIPNAVGATMVVNAQGERLAGTVGGGEIELQTVQACREAITERKHRRFTAHLTERASGGIGMMCGGKAEVFIQVHRPSPQLVLVGGGHINVELAKLGHTLGFRVTVIDDREAWCNEALYPHATRLQMMPEEALKTLEWNDDVYVVIATPDRDMPALKAALPYPNRYIGLVASQRKAIQFVRTLKQQGCDLSTVLPRLYAPIGLRLGGRTPADIALSIIAEIQLIYHGESGAHLRVTPEKMQSLV